MESLKEKEADECRETVLRKATEIERTLGPTCSP